MTDRAAGTGTADDPWRLTTPPGKAEYQMWRDPDATPPALVCQVGSTQLRYHLRAVDDLHAMLKAHGGWMPLGGADEQKPAAEGTVEAWGHSPDNPVGGWYGLKKGLRGRFRRLPAATARNTRAGRGHPRGETEPDASNLSPRGLRRSGTALAGCPAVANRPPSSRTARIPSDASRCQEQERGQQMEQCRYVLPVCEESGSQPAFLARTADRNDA